MVFSDVFSQIHVLFSDLVKKEQRIFPNETHIQKAMDWLCRAQDQSKGGGVSEGYHFYHGWLPPYPETTGYIIETFIDYFLKTGKNEIKDRALRMADWLISIQNEDGSIPDSYFSKKLVFDTGQVLLGLVKCYEETRQEKYKSAAIKAGDWLIQVQEPDGSWLKGAIGNVPHTYYSRVALSLLRLHKISLENRYRESGIKNIEWCLKQQFENGWFDLASFTIKNHNRPFTHTIAYTFDGILEAGIYLGEKKYILSIMKAMNNLISVLPENGFIPGTFDNKWGGDSAFTCLTGNAQLAINCFRLFEQTHDQQYLDRAMHMTTFLKSRHPVRKYCENIDGAVAGSYPIWGPYIHFMCPNWAAKFFIDALLLENGIVNDNGSSQKKNIASSIN